MSHSKTTSMMATSFPKELMFTRLNGTPNAFRLHVAVTDFSKGNC